MDAPSGSVSIRLACDADIPGINALGSRVFAESFGYSVQPHELEAFIRETYSHEATSELLADPNRDLIVALSEHTILGYALLTRNSSEPCVAHLSDTVELQRIYVDTTVHGKGIGGKLARHLEARAREQGFKWMWLGCWQENVKGLKVYEKLGYQIVGEHDFDVGGVPQRDHILLKSL